MEPFHQLSVSMLIVADLATEMETIGFSTEQADEIVLIANHPKFRTLVFVRGEKRTAYWVGALPADPNSHVLIYPNERACAEQVEIRTHLESRGAKWTYSDI